MKQRLLRQVRFLVPVLGALLLALPAAQARSTRPHAITALPRFMPIKRLTPGQRDSRVTSANINRTVCVAGYSATQRPPSSLTKNMERKAAVKYGIKNFDPDDYEGDHLIPISIGGSPEADGTLENFWPEPWKRTYRGEQVGARTKDGLERYLHRHVCKVRDLGLRQAQKEIAGDWYAAWVKYGRPKG